MKPGRGIVPGSKKKAMPAAAVQAFSDFDDAEEEGNKEVAKLFKATARDWQSWLQSMTGKDWKVVAGEYTLSMTSPRGKAIDVMWDFDPMFQKVDITVEGPGGKSKVFAKQAMNKLASGKRAAPVYLTWIMGEVMREARDEVLNAVMEMEEGVGTKVESLSDEIRDILLDEQFEQELRSLDEKVQKGIGAEYKRLRKKGMSAKAALSRSKERYGDEYKYGDEKETDKWVRKAVKDDTKRDASREKKDTERERHQRRSKGDPDKDARFSKKHSTERGKKQQDVERIRRKKGDAAAGAAKERILQKKGQKLKPGEKMVFGRVVKVESLSDEILGILTESAKGGKATRGQAQKGHGWSREEKKTHTKTQVRRSKRKEIERQMKGEHSLDTVLAYLDALVQEGITEIPLFSLTERTQLDAGMERALNNLASVGQSHRMRGAWIEKWANDALASGRMDVASLLDMASKAVIARETKAVAAAIGRVASMAAAMVNESEEMVVEAKTAGPVVVRSPGGYTISAVTTSAMPSHQWTGKRWARGGKPKKYSSREEAQADLSAAKGAMAQVVFEDDHHFMKIGCMGCDHECSNGCDHEDGMCPECGSKLGLAGEAGWMEQVADVVESTLMEAGPGDHWDAIEEAIDEFFAEEFSIDALMEEAGSLEEVISRAQAQARKAGAARLGAAATRLTKGKTKMSRGQERLLKAKARAKLINRERAYRKKKAAAKPKGDEVDVLKAKVKGGIDKLKGAFKKVAKDAEAKFKGSKAEKVAKSMDKLAKKGGVKSAVKSGLRKMANKGLKMVFGKWVKVEALAMGLSDLTEDLSEARWQDELVRDAVRDFEILVTSGHWQGLGGSAGLKYINRLLRIAQRLEKAAPKVARSIRVTASDMESDIDQRGKTNTKDYRDNLMADLRQLQQLQSKGVFGMGESVDIPPTVGPIPSAIPERIYPFDDDKRITTPEEGGAVADAPAREHVARNFPHSTLKDELQMILRGDSISQG